MYKVYTGETVEDALQKGLSDLNVEENDINIDVLEEGSKGFLGFMKKEAKVKLTIINPELKQLDSIEDIQNRYQEAQKVEERKETIVGTEPEIKEVVEDKIEINETPAYDETDVKHSSFTFEEAAESTANYIQSVITEMDISNYTDFTINDREVTINIFSKTAAKVIGKRGTTLNALGEIAQHYFNRIYKGYGRIILDTENYREKRKETLENLAINMSKKAVRTDLPVHLEPMPAYERKIIHNVLYNVTNIKTYSSGKEPNRHIVIEKE